MNQKKNKFELTPQQKEQLNQIPGYNKICGVCCSPINALDILKRKNGPVKIMNMPGFYHKRCKADFDVHLVSTSVVTDIFNR